MRPLPLLWLTVAAFLLNACGPRNEGDGSPPAAAASVETAPLSAPAGVEGTYTRIDGKAGALVLRRDNDGWLAMIQAEGLEKGLGQPAPCQVVARGRLAGPRFEGELVPFDGWYDLNAEDLRQIRRHVAITLEDGAAVVDTQAMDHCGWESWVNGRYRQVSTSTASPISP